MCTSPVLTFFSMDFGLILLRLFFLAISCHAFGASVDLLSRARMTSYKNPIISGFAPDPSCTRVGEQFFCVSSSFSAFPGIPVYTSRDLLRWRQIGSFLLIFKSRKLSLKCFEGNVLSRPEQLPALATVNSSTGGIWAATIRQGSLEHHLNSCLTVNIIQTS